MYNKEKFIREVERYFDGFVCVETYTMEPVITFAESIITQDGVDYITVLSDKYMCSNLSGVVYDSLKDIADKLYNYLTLELGETIINVR